MAITNKENLMLAMRHEIPQRIPNFRQDACCYIPSCIFERAPGDGTPAQALGGTGRDWFGVEWLFEPKIGGSMVNPFKPPLMSDVTKWREIVHFPDLEAIDWAAARERDDKLVKPDRFCVVTLLNGPFERLHALMGMVEANCSLLEEPEEVAALFMAIADYKIAVMKKVLQYYPVDMFELHDDWGHNSDTFFSKSVWHALIAPAMKKMADFIHGSGKFIQVHSCGKVESLIPDMIEIGIDHWSSCQACNNIRNVLCRYGRQLTCLGGMDAPELVDPNKSYEERKELTWQRMDDLCKGGGLLVYGSRTYPELIRMIGELIEEHPDYYQKPENRRLPVMK